MKGTYRCAVCSLVFVTNEAISLHFVTSHNRPGRCCDSLGIKHTPTGTKNGRLEWDNNEGYPHTKTLPLRLGNINSPVQIPANEDCVFKKPKRRIIRLKCPPPVVGRVPDCASKRPTARPELANPMLAKPAATLPRPAGLPQCFQCQTCPQSFSAIDQAALHMLEVHCDATKQCHYCEASSADFNGLRIHMEIKQGEEQGRRIVLTSGCAWCTRGLSHSDFCMVKKQGS